MTLAQSLDTECSAPHELGDRVFVSENNSLFVDVRGLEGWVCGHVMDIYGDFCGYEVYFRKIGRTFTVLDKEIL